MADAAPIERSKAMIGKHEQLVADGQLDLVMENFAEDVVMVTNDQPVLEGRSAVRGFYEEIFPLGTWRFVHDYDGATAFADSVILYGVSRGQLEPNDGSRPTKFENNFLIITKLVGGDMKIGWAAFMPGKPS